MYTKISHMVWTKNPFLCEHLFYIVCISVLKMIWMSPANRQIIWHNFLGFFFFNQCMTNNLKHYNLHIQFQIITLTSNWLLSANPDSACCQRTSTERCTSWNWVIHVYLNKMDKMVDIQNYNCWLLTWTKFLTYVVYILHISCTQSESQSRKLETTVAILWTISD